MKSMIYPLVNTYEKVIYVCFFMIIKCALAKRRRLTDISIYQTFEQGFAHILINWLIQKSQSSIDFNIFDHLSERKYFYFW